MTAKELELRARAGEVVGDGSAQINALVALLDEAIEEVRQLTSELAEAGTEVEQLEERLVSERASWIRSSLEGEQHD